jgi:site-specific DNA-methyltransferase (adenine-specific)
MREFLNIDCMEGMKQYPDKYFDLAITDPPYGTQCNLKGGSSRFGGNGWNKNKFGDKVYGWNIAPGPDYFTELFRVSKNQIIWGGNYFTLPCSSGWIVWDKGQREFTLADGELAWTSFNKALRIFDYSRASANREGGRHPTEKPLTLYKWLIKNYAKEGFKILDTHVGSASSLIAFEEFGLDYVGFELDPKYYSAAVKRIEKYREQGKLFQPGFEQ